MFLLSHHLPWLAQVEFYTSLKDPKSLNVLPIVCFLVGLLSLLNGKKMITLLCLFSNKSRTTQNLLQVKIIKLLEFTFLSPSF